MGKGKSPEPKKRYEKREKKRKVYPTYTDEVIARKGFEFYKEAMAELEWLKSVYKEDKERQKKEQQRLARNARRRARYAEKKANSDGKYGTT